ncbi:hypothetical protein F5Y05DRAFT_72409 [Hypoxylon sp. FL0543]|nr:hypothetical protein F5Y05DRAFT_72409 [Hypoxylon sp. FL0543]
MPPWGTVRFARGGSSLRSMCISVFYLGISARYCTYLTYRYAARSLERFRESSNGSLFSLFCRCSSWVVSLVLRRGVCLLIPGYIHPCYAHYLEGMYVGM